MDYKSESWSWSSDEEPSELPVNLGTMRDGVQRQGSTPVESGVPAEETGGRRSTFGSGGVEPRLPLPLPLLRIMGVLVAAGLRRAPSSTGTDLWLSG